MGSFELFFTFIPLDYDVVGGFSPEVTRWRLNDFGSVIPTALAILTIRMFSRCIPPVTLNRYLASRFFIPNFDSASAG